MALITLGPKQLIVIAEKLGRWLKQWRHFNQQLKSDLEKYQVLSENEKRAETVDKQYENKT